MQQERYGFAWPVVDLVKCLARRVPGRGVEDMPEAPLRAVQGMPVAVVQPVALKQTLDLEQFGEEDIAVHRRRIADSRLPLESAVRGQIGQAKCSHFQPRSCVQTLLREARLILTATIGLMYRNKLRSYSIVSSARCSIIRDSCRIAARISSTEKFSQGVIWTLLPRNDGT
jgi:hypothetical protein